MGSGLPSWFGCAQTVSDGHGLGLTDRGVPAAQMISAKWPRAVPTNGHDRTMEDGARTRHDVVEELVGLVLDQLVPAVGWYRDQLAHRLEIGLPGLAVVEGVRAGPTTAGRLALRTGMTPSAVTKVIRRLEAQGHVERTPSRTHEQELVVRLVPHELRDLVLDDIRTDVRGAVLHVVSTLGLRDEGNGHVAANLMVQVVHALGREAWVMGHRAAADAHRRRLRRERERRGHRPRWQR